MMSTVYMIFILFSLILFKLYFKISNKFCHSQKRLDGKTCVVTGGSRGLGFEIAKEFARRGAKVILTCPSEEEGTAAQETIKKETGNHKVIFKHLELASFESTRRFAQDILSSEDRLDILINNAGISAQKRMTIDGLNSTMQINYFGHFLLTILLLPLLKKSGSAIEKSRIVNTASMYHNSGVFVPDSAYEINDWSLTEIYGSSKLYLLLFATELKKRLKGQNVVVNTSDPGAAGTTIFNTAAGPIKGFFLTYFLYLFVKTPWEGAQTALHVALADELEDVSGEYFTNCTRTRAKAISYDVKVAEMLWNESLQVVKLRASEIGI